MVNSNPNVLCVGYLNLDEVIHIEDELLEEKSTRCYSALSAGGGATNTGLVLSSSDQIGDVWIAGGIGNDKRGDMVYSTLEEYNVKLAIPRHDDYNTTKIRAIVSENMKPRYIHEDTDLPDFGSDSVDDSIWDKVDHVHSTTFHPDISEEFAKRAKKEGCTFSLNPTQGYADTDYSDVVQESDLVQMNRQESEIFRDRNGPLGNVVADLDTDVVITHGPAGCTMYSSDGVVSHSGYPNKVDNVVDTIGAGDSFMAGLLSAWLNDMDLEDCLKFANSYGAVSVMERGAPDFIDPRSASDIRE